MLSDSGGSYSLGHRKQEGTPNAISTHTGVNVPFLVKYDIHSGSWTCLPRSICHDGSMPIHEMFCQVYLDKGTAKEKLDREFVSHANGHMKVIKCAWSLKALHWNCEHWKHFPPLDPYSNSLQKSWRSSLVPNVLITDHFT